VSQWDGRTVWAGGKSGTGALSSIGNSVGQLHFGAVGGGGERSSG
jgi:hypothetical protein